MRRNKKVWISSIIIALSLFLLGCGKDEQFQVKSSKQKGYKLYYVSSNQEKIVYDDFSIKSTDIDRIINEIIIKLKVGNYLKAKEPVIPKEIESSIYTLSANILNLNFDEKYLELKGRDEVLRRAAIVLTFCQLEQIDYVRITVAGKTLQSEGKDIGNMSKSTFIDMIGEKSDYILNENISLYYADSTGKKLRKLPPPLDSFKTIVAKKIVSVGSKIDSIMSVLRTQGKQKIFDFYKTATSRSDLVASFLAILELAKDKSIYLTGDGEDIQIELLEGNENT